MLYLTTFRMLPGSLAFESINMVLTSDKLFPRRKILSVVIISLFKCTFKVISFNGDRGTFISSYLEIRQAYS